MIGLLWEQEIGGSNPLTPTTAQRRIRRFAQVRDGREPATNPLKSRAALAGWLLALAILVALLGGPEPSNANDGTTLVGCLTPSAHPHFTCTGLASAYGPGLYGNRTACRNANGRPIILKKGTVGVAHKTLPCNARVTICAAHRCAAVRVIDRGPFVTGRTFDLTEGTTRRVWHMSARKWGIRTVTYHRGWNK